MPSTAICVRGAARAPQLPSSHAARRTTVRARASATLRAVFRTAVAAWLLAAPAGARQATPDDAQQVLGALAKAWEARDVDGYLALWRFARAEDRQEETEFVRARFDAEQATLSLQPPRAAGGRLSVDARVVTISEPRGRAEEWVLGLER